MTHNQKLQLIKALVKHGKIAEAVSMACYANIEQGYMGKRRGFFIDNAASTASAAGVSPQQFAGALGALQQAGKYEPSCDPEYRGNFGYMVHADFPQD